MRIKQVTAQPEPKKNVITLHVVKEVVNVIAQIVSQKLKPTRVVRINGE